MSGNLEPVFIKTCDVNLDFHSNRILAVFFGHNQFKFGKSAIEVTVIWNDEDLPEPISNCCYDALRRYWLWGRREDKESFWLVFGRHLPDTRQTNETPEFVYFRSSYSDATYFSCRGLHKKRKIPYENLERDPDTNRPVLYVNTWNNSFCERDTNNAGEDKAQRISDYTRMDGDREQAEQWIKSRR